MVGSTCCHSAVVWSPAAKSTRIGWFSCVVCGVFVVRASGFGTTVDEVVDGPVSTVGGAAESPARRRGQRSGHIVQRLRHGRRQRVRIDERGGGGGFAYR